MFVRPLVLAAIASTAGAQQFVRNTTDIPGSSRDTEQVDFADVDLDGDWDAGFANGGDIANQQNVLWINQGGLQGGVVGTFFDATTTRFPTVLDSTRDLEFADYDGDGDADIALANHSQITNQPSRFWTNQGGAQGATLGAYVDETSTRWVGLGGQGSSIAPALVLAGGGFIDFPQETDFADFDDDGDLDLVQATVGSAFSGTIPTRLFSNDGAGHFTEFNPSGFQLGGASIVNGNPGLWCAGSQSANTMDATGTFCDVALAADDADWADVDGDLDIDLLLCDERAAPRLFQNRLEENGGIPGFRDVTGASFQAGYSTGSGHYEQCLGDFDGDDDLDIYGVNWLVGGFSFTDAALRNDGTGYFDSLLPIAASNDDDQTAEPIDYDLDGDLDVYVSNFNGQDRMVANLGGWSLANASGVLQNDATVTLDSDFADVDQDGDEDIFDANGGTTAEWYRENTTSANDVTAPRIAHLEQAADRWPGLLPTRVRCHLYDNTAPQRSQWLAASLEVRVNGASSTQIPMKSSFAQVFRGEIPGATIGVIDYRVVVADEHGNTGQSAWRTYTVGVTGTAFCSGDGTGTPCPCGNNSSAGRGCGNSLGAGARLTGSGVTSVTGDTFVLTVSAVPNSSVLFFQGTAQVNGGAGTVLGDGLRCAGGVVRRLGTKSAAMNIAQYPQMLDQPISVRGQIPVVGGTRTYQAWYRNAADYCTPSTFNLSNGWETVWGA